MDSSWLLVVLAATVFVSLVVLAIVCLDCRNTGPLVSIRQASASEIYMPSTEFRIIHPSQPTNDVPPNNLTSTMLSPLPHPSDPGTQRRQRSFTPTETESNPSYENGPESFTEDYIIVLPDGEGPLMNQSRASTPSSDAQHDYENVKPEDTDYLNVEPLHSLKTHELSAQSESDDDEVNYVNQPPMIHSRSSTSDTD